MGYFGYGTIVLLLNVAIIAFLLITYFKEILEFMEEEDIGYGGYNDVDWRVWLIVLLFLLACLLSWLLWPVMLVVWAVGILFIAMKQNDKFKRIIAILKEDVKKDE